MKVKKLDYLMNKMNQIVLKYLDKLGNRGGALYQQCLNTLVEHKEFIKENGVDMDVIRNWKWHDINVDEEYI